MSWHTLDLAPDATHHLCDGRPAYAARFDAVQKFHAPGLAPVRLADLAWHIYPDGGAAYAHCFAQTFGYYEGKAAVVDPQGWRHVDARGEAIYAARFAWCGNYQGGRCAVRRNDGTYLHLGPQGEPAYADAWRYAGDYRDGIAVVQREDGLSTHIDLAGAPIHERWFLDLDVFHKGHARGRDVGGWTHLTREGQPLYQRRFAAIEPFYNGQARVECFDTSLDIIDERGRTVLQLRAGAPLAGRR